MTSKEIPLARIYFLIINTFSYTERYIAAYHQDFQLLILSSYVLTLRYMT
jgi:hypothetical protein